MPLLQDGEGSNYLYRLLTLVSETWGMVLQCQISPGRRGAGGGVESASTFSILPAALPVPYYWRLRGVNGIEGPRRL